MKFSDPFKILIPSERWAPTQSQMDMFQNAYEKLLPPLVYKIRLAVEKWRDEDYAGASETSKLLMNFWFNQEHLIGQSKFLMSCGNSTSFYPHLHKNFLCCNYKWSNHFYHIPME